MENIIDRLEYFMNQIGLNDNRLTNEAGLSVGLIGKARKVRKGLHSDTIEKILHTYSQLNPLWFITGQGTWSNAHLNAQPNAHLTEKNTTKTGVFIPAVITMDRDDRDVITVVGTKVAAGYLAGYSDPEFIEKLNTISMPGFTGALHRGFEIKGNSMPPIHPGAISIGRYVEQISDITGRLNRRVYIVVTKSDGIVLKRVINSPVEQKLILISDNANKKEFPNYTVDYEEVLELWYWRAAFIRELPDPSVLYERMNDMEAQLTFIKQTVAQMQGKGPTQIKLNG